MGAFDGLHVVVTGGAGALGSAVTRYMLDAGATYQFSFAAPAGFFFRQDLGAFETAVAATRRADVAAGVAGP